MLERGPVLIRSLIDFLVTMAIIFESILFSTTIKSLLLHVYASLLTGRTVVWSTTTTAAAAAAATQTSAAVFFFSSCSAADD